MGHAAVWRAARRRGIDRAAFWWLFGMLAAATLGLTAIFLGCGWTLESQGPVLWSWVAAWSMVVGAVGAARTQKLPVFELTLASLPLLELATCLALWFAREEGLASAPLRALMVLPPAMALCGYFGASVGYLLWGAGGGDRHIGYEFMIGRRFLLSKSSPVLSTVTTISVLGVTLGVWLVLVSLGVLAGFEDDLQRKIIGSNAHIVLHRPDQKPFALAPQVQEAAAHVAGVTDVAPFVEGEVALKSSSNYGVAMVFGVDARVSARVLSALDQLVEGSLDALEVEQADFEAPPTRAGADANAEFLPPTRLPNIVIGREMAKTLNVEVGDRIRAISPVLEVLTPMGPAPKSAGFRVAAIFSTKMYEYDSRYVYMTLPAARRFFELQPGFVSGLHLRCESPDHTERVSQRLRQVDVIQEFDVPDWRQRNQTLFSALKLEKVVAFVVLVFIILVASFSIVNTLTMSVIEKRREIAILKTMGARDVGIMKVFVVQGLLVGTFGTLCGALLGVGTMKSLEHFGFWIPVEVYYIDSLPVKLDMADVALVLLAALLIVWDFAVFPALQASELEPVEGLRDG